MTPVRHLAIAVVCAASLASSEAYGALACGDVTTNITGTDRSSATIAYSTPSGTAQTLIVGVVNRDVSDTVSTVTHAGNSMTEKIELHHSTGVANAALYFIKDPTSGTNDVVVTWTGTVLASGVFIMTCSGTATDGDPFRNAGASAEGLGTAISVTATDEATDLTIDVFGIDLNGVAPTIGADQTTIFAGTDGGEIAMGASYQPGGNGASAWTADSSNDWAAVVAPLKALASSFMMRRRVQ